MFKTNVLVEKAYYVLVSEDGDYIKLERDNTISIVKKTYQATKGTKEEMIRFYANLEKLINANPDEYSDIKFGGLLGIVERVENDTYIDLNEINNILNEFEPKEGLSTSGHQVVQVGLNIVQNENQVWEDFQSLLNKELGIEESDDCIFINTKKSDEFNAYFEGDEDLPFAIEYDGDEDLPLGVNYKDLPFLMDNEDLPMGIDKTLEEAINPSKKSFLIDNPVAEPIVLNFEIEEE